MFFDIKKKYLRQKETLVVGGHVVELSEHTTYSLTIKYTSVRLMLTIEVKNGLGLMAVDIGNAFFTSPHAENIWSTCGQKFGAKFGDIVVLKLALYKLQSEQKIPRFCKRLRFLKSGFSIFLIFSGCQK